ncbi:hydroxymethylglutaryl-coenzyme A reductase [Encephalitozoon hellem ATCC 50504]|uniref:hydroxymethylglutaryl-CoA reductase (NADPH) n=1 Tax=Encephalitozoon hellem TaxID=27973 RepID=A0A9Q9FAE3_ENCHE|nr:hydroxymethylglutaryl-coenzyme A reductase [Encephalitozoon hellem ATCC 50504]AFM99268.1 hydroxymethylglutaryl-coenzyme A reductase [Encephalitozoon hellem ATCC 50504]UTX44256.1 hydroxymethylglutaryl-coenzyme A reductase [Encephalitozoon hellem]WEL39747.1 3-hydroxy-3-methylglutaryl CoA reductase [Encephalitozoon hellem]|eukprot:XP_003888249.1 hydroxymethylglutaryl-coenzyme A reductase [Encephalitozoon hellem ATCC 50504]
MDINKEANERAGELRKKIEEVTGIRIEGVGREEDYSGVINRCCENLIGYKKVPLGVSNRGVLINNKEFFIPIATTEGALVASMSRGIKLINACGGVEGYAENVGITRGFIMRFRTFKEAMEFYQWIKMDESVANLKRVGNEGSKHLRISKIESKHVVGEDVYVKVYGYSGDAMGMNMITKACVQISNEIMRMFPNTSLVSISSNTCTDKKWSGENYCNGRGRRIFMNIKIDDRNCREILGVGIDEILDVYHAKVVVGGSLVLGGFNCQAANYVAGMFLALGQDLGQVVESSNCILSMKKSAADILSVSLFMPSVTVGIIGGGTHLEPSKSFLRQFSKGSDEYIITNKDEDKSSGPGYLGLAVGAAVLGGELSLLGSLANNTLMESHERLNRGGCPSSGTDKRH